MPGMVRVHLSNKKRQMWKMSEWKHSSIHWGSSNTANPVDTKHWCWQDNGSSIMLFAPQTPQTPKHLINLLHSLDLLLESQKHHGLLKYMFVQMEMLLSSFLLCIHMRYDSSAACFLYQGWKSLPYISDKSYKKKCLCVTPDKNFLCSQTLFPCTVTTHFINSDLFRIQNFFLTATKSIKVSTHSAYGSVHTQLQLAFNIPENSLLA